MDPLTKTNLSAQRQLVEPRRITIENILIPCTGPPSAKCQNVYVSHPVNRVPTVLAHRAKTSISPQALRHSPYTSSTSPSSYIAVRAGPFLHVTWTSRISAHYGAGREALSICCCRTDCNLCRACQRVCTRWRTSCGRGRG